MRFRALAVIRSLLVIAFLVGQTQGAVAQLPSVPKAATIEPIAVTATRQSQPLTDVLADVTVIDREEIAHAGVQALTDLLARQPGVEIVQNGGPGAVSGVFLRGANSAQTLVLIDGMRIASSSTGASSLEAIPLDQIERIEILRGPASSLYGADAIGGVIQVFTRRAGAGVGANVSAGYGSYRTWDANGGIAGSRDGVQFALQAAAKESRGFNAIADPTSSLYNPDRDGYRNQSLSGSVGVTFAPGQEASAQYFRSRLDNQFDSSPTFDDRTITVVEAWQVRSHNRLASSWVSKLSAGQGVDDSESRTGFGASPFKTTQRQYAWQNELTLPFGALTAGYERREERVSTNAAFATTHRDTDSLFGIYQASIEKHALQANLRHDDSSQFGGRTTGALLYGYRIVPSWRITAGYSTGFKAPTFNDLYYPGYSNPSLVPEKSHSVETGVYWNGHVNGIDLAARAVGYRNRVTDLIVFQCDASFNCAPQNVSRATLEGVTLAMDSRFANGAVLGVAVDVQSPEDDDTGHLLPRRARRHGVMNATLPVGPGRYGVEIVGSSARFDDAANVIKMGGYAVLNVIAEWTLGDRVTLFARADNVLDRQYELAAGYARSGRMLFGGVRAYLK